MQARRLAILILGISFFMGGQDEDKRGLPKTLDPPDDAALQMLAIPWTVERTPSRKTSLRRLSDSWNRLIEGIRREESRFTNDENAALDAILLQIQGGLISIGLAPANTSIRKQAGDLRQLVPNTAALRAFFERKHRERPQSEELKRLSGYAATLAQETRLATPTVPLRSSGH